MNYEVAKPSDSDEIVRLLARVFSQSEPPAVAMGLSFPDMKQFLQLVVPSAIPDGLTVISRSGGTGELAGVLLTDDFASPPDLDTSQISPKFSPILSMLERLDEQFRKGRTISPGNYLHLFMLGVEGRFAGQGIGQDSSKPVSIMGLGEAIEQRLPKPQGKSPSTYFGRTALSIALACCTGTSSTKTKRCSPRSGSTNRRC